MFVNLGAMFIFITLITILLAAVRTNTNQNKSRRVGFLFVKMKVMNILIPLL